MTSRVVVTFTAQPTSLTVLSWSTFVGTNFPLQIYRRFTFSFETKKREQSKFFLQDYKTFCAACLLAQTSLCNEPIHFCALSKLWAKREGSNALFDIIRQFALRIFTSPCKWTCSQVPTKLSATKREKKASFFSKQYVLCWTGQDRENSRRLWKDTHGPAGGAGAGTIGVTTRSSILAFTVFWATDTMTSFRASQLASGKWSTHPCFSWMRNDTCESIDNFLRPLSKAIWDFQSLLNLHILPLWTSLLQGAQNLMPRVWKQRRIFWWTKVTRNYSANLQWSLVSSRAGAPPVDVITGAVVDTGARSLAVQPERSHRTHLVALRPTIPWIS